MDGISEMAQMVKVKVFTAKHEDLSSSPKTHALWKETPTNYSLIYTCTLSHMPECTCIHTFN